MQNQKEKIYRKRSEEKKKESHVLALDPIHWKNYKRIIGEICEHATQEINEDPVFVIDRAKKIYLKKVAQDYSQDDDKRIALNRIVWSGHFDEVCIEYFKEGDNLEKGVCCLLL